MSRCASVVTPVALSTIAAVRWTSDELYFGIKDHYALGRVESGRVEWWGSGKVWTSTPGSIQVKEPGDVHRDLARDVSTWAFLTLPSHDIERARLQMGDGKGVAIPQLEAGDPRGAPFHRLLDAAFSGADRLTLEVCLAEAVTALAVISSARPDHSRPVRRAMDYLRDRLADSITLDDLADHAGLDKFHLCRAFRAQVGLPPHAYLTHLRIARAKELLRGGTRASEVAPLVGLYDQAQLTRHFRRIVGTTPARYGGARSQADASPW